MPEITVAATSTWFRTRRWPTWRVWLPLLSLVLAALAWLGLQAHDWLAVTDRVADARYVVVEGWAPDAVVLAAEQEFDDLNAKLLLTTGLPLETGTFLSEYKDFATLAATTLAKSGMPAASIYPVPAAAVARDRTAAMATALRSALDGLAVPPAERKIQLITSSVHARRSQKIYQRILGPDWQVGVVSITNPSYPAAQWYRHSAGAKGVIDELVALGVVLCGGE